MRLLSKGNRGGGGGNADRPVLSLRCLLQLHFFFFFAHLFFPFLPSTAFIFWERVYYSQPASQPASYHMYVRMYNMYVCMFVCTIIQLSYGVRTYIHTYIWIHIFTGCLASNGLEGQKSREDGEVQPCPPEES